MLERVENLKQIFSKDERSDHAVATTIVLLRQVALSLATDLRNKMAARVAQGEVKLG